MGVLRNDLPFGCEFSPSQVDLADLLEMARAHGGNRKGFEELVRITYFERYDTSDRNKSKLANNTRLSMISYGLIDRQVNMTPLGEKLYSLRADRVAMHAALARHALLFLHGLTFVECIQDMQQAGEPVTLVALRKWLGERGLHFPRGGRHPSTLRAWLAQAGVFVDRWRIDEERLKELVGMEAEEIDALALLSHEQRAFLRTLANIEGDGPFASNDLEKLAAATYGVSFNEKNLPKSVLYPLQHAGYITLERGTKERGRGAKPFLVRPTSKLVADVVEPVLAQIEKRVGADLRPLLRKPLAAILEELSSTDTHVRGLALEALAFKLMRLVDLSYVATRLRGAATGGAEVDLIFESSRLMYSRWQVQCKNTSSVSLDDVAKEVGLTHMLKSNVIVMVSTGQIGPKARDYASKVMQDSNLCIIMVDGQDLDAILANPTAIADIFNREARNAMRLKALDIQEE